MEFDKFKHCRTSSRIGELSLILLQLILTYNIPVDFIKVFYKIILEFQPEKEGQKSLEDKKNRELVERLEHKAEKYIPLYKNLGFNNILEFIYHKRQEILLLLQFNDLNLQNKLYIWEKFGFQSENEYMMARLEEFSRSSFKNILK